MYLRTMLPVHSYMHNFIKQSCSVVIADAFPKHDCDALLSCLCYCRLGTGGSNTCTSATECSGGCVCVGNLMSTIVL